MPPSVVVAGVYSSPSAAELPPEPEDEYVVLVNVGDEPADLRGWSLTNRKLDDQDHYRYLFPRFLSNGDPWLLEPGGMVLLYTGRGTNGRTATVGEAPQIHLYQHRGTRIWRESGERVRLFDRAGQLVSQWELPGVPWSTESA